MKILITAQGSIGKRHGENLRRLVPNADIGFLHLSGRPPAPDSQDFQSLEKATDFQPDLVLVTGPATTHAKCTLHFLPTAKAIFIEKPLVASEEDLNLLYRFATEGESAILVEKIMVGYTLRFSTGLRTMRRLLKSGLIGRILHANANVGQYLPDWRPDSDYRSSVSARKELGGGAVLELSHEIDYLRWLVGEVKYVQALTTRRSHLEIDVEDTAEILLEHADGIPSHVHLDMTSPVPVRTCTVTGTEGTLTWDGIARTTRLFSRTNPAGELLDDASETERNQLYLDQMTHFLEFSMGNAEPQTSFADAVQVTRILLAIKSAAASHKREAVP